METSKTKQIVMILILVLVIPIFLGLLFGGMARIGSIVLFIFTFGIPLLMAYIGLKSLKRIIWLNVIISVPLIIIAGIFAYEKMFMQLIFVPLVCYAFVMLLINLISVFKFWSDYNFAKFIPLLISILTIVLTYFSLEIGHRVNIYVFKKRLPQYQAVIKIVENQIGDEPLYLVGKDLPPQYRNLAISINAEKENSVLGVSFLWGVGFSLKHTAYAYVSDGRIPEKGTELRGNWHYWERINDHWFYVGD